MLTLGIDDAGRGPVIGPMVLAGCLINDEIAKDFKEKGIKDSKQLTPKRREFLAKYIKEKAETFEVVIVLPHEIDDHSHNGINLNDVEAMATASIINAINKSQGKIRVVVDCPSPNLGKWGDFLKTKVENHSNLDISCEHKADINHIACSAASIIAKTIRDGEIEKIKGTIKENFGSGYPSDPLTCEFLEKYAHKYKDRKIFRTTWSTWKDACAKQEQKRLGI